MLSDDDIIKSLKRPRNLLVMVAIITCVFTVSAFYDSESEKHSYSDILVNELKHEALYNPKYEVTYSRDDAVMRSINTIRSTNDCDTLIDLFERNTGWTVRPMLAHKILSQCIK